ncbi:putative L-threo-3-deoxy-hexylosonate aldolase [[Candida] jaroonii]|uniref:L-threo-3-deoxy-hexylosonate aldolase n=1 Tax=[Candida] jaroonii TaxID=467808 RepID=A0ACA9YDZ4_9ASCO|nr:putative L-threo-3-deoxy-hexylosonate aldolase [[Candida] jaroonii]
MVCGVFVPVPTFFNDDESIDFETQVKHAQFLKDNGISGITLLGSTGENVHLTAKERVEIVKSIHDGVADFPIVAGVAQNCLSDAKDEIKRLADSGASYALVLPSSYYGAGITQEALVEWYTNVADFSPIPVLIYVYPGVTNGVSVAPSTIKTLSKHSNIKGIKFSHNDVTAYSEVSLDEEITDFDCLTGLGHLFLPALSVGFKGTVDAIAGAFPKIYVSLYKAFEKGDLKTAKALQLSIIRVEKIVAEFGVIGIKRIIHEVGFGKNYLGRSPLNKDTSTGWERMSNYIQEVKTIEAKLA